MSPISSVFYGNTFLEAGNLSALSKLGADTEQCIMGWE